VCICLVTFGDDNDTVRNLSGECWYAIESGVLRLGSGGIIGLVGQEASPQLLSAAARAITGGRAAASRTCSC
jgi:hypothetical protein